MTPLRHKKEEYGSTILALTHSFFQTVIFVTMTSIYRLLGFRKEEVTLHHAEVFLVSTTLLLSSLIALSQIVLWLGWVVVVLGNLRIIQIISLNLMTLMFDFTPTGDPSIAVKRARWHLVAIGFSFIDAVLSFAFMYQFFDQRYQILNNHFPNFFHYVYYSVITITTTGYGDVFPVVLLGKFIAMYEASVGLFFLVFLVSGAVGRLQKHV
ncbi:MAG: two pore domain potassium channel family protein [Deltaproteobacteria bacterium]|nr:two pore domain potassium channel family protein [Deltaproteobacteria bacterium]